ncbi:MAG TPA: hypothetical protein VFK06_17430 [Candidatus Angelobacter sp.]|nr:hypothetical protein [Candidatus Angelobacter sp.]
MSLHVSRLILPLLLCGFAVSQQEAKPAADASTSPEPAQNQPGQPDTKTKSQIVVKLGDEAKADSSPHANPLPNLEKRPRLDDATKLQLIQIFNAEVTRVRKTLPLGAKDIIVTSDGYVTPGEARLYQMASVHGTAAKIGEQVRITNVVFKDKSIRFDINGGEKRKSHWYDHVSVGVGSAGGVSTPQQDTNQQATGAVITLVFKNHVPEMNAEELRQLLNPIFDFSLKSASEVATETLPPKVQAAVKRHEVLVGMNRDMVVLAKERPEQKVREQDEKGHDYEEWIYGKPPQEVVYVRFVGDEVVQVKTAKIGQEIVTKTQKEVDVKDGIVSIAAARPANNPPESSAQDKPVHRPTLRRGDDPPDPALQPTTVIKPKQKEEPQWGEQPGQNPPQSQTPAPGSPPPPQ